MRRLSVSRLVAPSLSHAVLLGVVLMSAPATPRPATGPLRACPENPRYFADASGRPILLVGSHVWNNLQDMGRDDPPAPFDWEAYLDFLQARNHNFIRLWHWNLTRWDTAANREEDPRALYCEPHPWVRTGPG